MRRLVVAVIVLALGALASPAGASSSLPGACLRLSPEPAGPWYFQAVGLDRYLLQDPDGRLLATSGRVSRPGPEAEWTARLRGRRLTLDHRSGRPLRFRATSATGCRAFPEAELNATGKPARGRAGRPLTGLADPHVHVVADLRAGGRVIHGRTFHRYGIAEALGHDEVDHGPDGTLDITGNLLRTGSPVGTHDTDGWPTFTGWPTHDTNTHQQVYFRWLQRAWLGGLRLVVAQTVEDEPLCRLEPLRSHPCDEQQTVASQVRRLRELQDHVDAQSGGRGKGWLRLVEEPADARRAIERGKLAVLIGMETSNLFGCDLRLGLPGCDRADIDAGVRRLRELGVRSVFVAHWVDNALAGAALEGGDKGTFISSFQVLHTGAPFQTGPCPEEGQGEEVVEGTGRRCNTRGLTELGEYAVRRLMDAGMLIEADHLSERARRRVLEIAAARTYPGVVSSHTDTGGTWAASELRSLSASGGFASARVEAAVDLPRKVAGLQERLGTAAPVGLSTDMGGFATMPGPSPEGGTLAYPFRSYDGRVSFDRQRSGTRTFDLNIDGMAHYGLLPDLLAHVGQQPGGCDTLGTLFKSAEAYVAMWARAQRAR